MNIVLLLSIPAFALDSSTAYQWLNTYSQTSEAKEILSRYYGLEADFSSQLHSWSRKQLAKSASSAIRNHQANKCTESTLFKIIDGSKHFTELAERELQFTESLILIETAYCIPDASLKEAYDVYMSEEFRTNVMPQVASFTVKGSLYCTKGEGVFGIVKPADYCYKAKEKRGEKTIIVRNSFQSVSQGEAYQPFYFREEVLTFVQMDSGVGLYRATFTRSADLSSTSKYFLRTTVDSSQGNIREQYYEWLNEK